MLRTNDMMLCINDVALRANLCYTKPKVGEDMLKEKLTTQNIRQDLKLELKKNYMRVVGSSVFSLIIIGLIILAFSTANVYGGYLSLIHI